MGNLGHHRVFARLETRSKPILSPQQTDQVMTIQPGDISRRDRHGQERVGTISSKPDGRTSRSESTQPSASSRRVS